MYWNQDQFTVFKFFLLNQWKKLERDKVIDLLPQSFYCVVKYCVTVLSIFPFEKFNFTWLNNFFNLFDLLWVIGVKLLA